MVDEYRENNDSGPADAGAPHQPEPPQGDAVNERLRRGLFWALQYWRELFNFRFLCNFFSNSIKNVQCARAKL